MDISSVAVTSMVTNAAPTEMSVAVMRKVLDSQLAAAQQLTDTIEQSGRALPDNLGNNLNVTA